MSASIVYALLILYVVVVTALALRDVGLDCLKSWKVPATATIVVTTVGGLVGALVVAQLALTSPGGQSGGLHELMKRSDGSHSRVRSALVWLYVGGWLVTGLFALGVAMLVEGPSQVVVDIGTAWLGTAVAAGYAFFSLDPGQKGQ